MTPITLLDRIDDHLIPRPAFIVAEGYAMGIIAGQLWLDRVIPVAGRPSTHESDGGIVLTEDTRRGDVLIAEIYGKLRTMTAFDFVVSVLLPPGIDIEMFPPDDPH